MKLAKLSILFAAIWCTLCLVVSLIAGAVVVFCTSPDIPQCGSSGYEVAVRWRQLAPISIAFFAAGAFVGFRTVMPEVCSAFHAISRALRLSKSRKP